MNTLRRIGFWWRVVIGVVLLLILWAIFALVGSGSGHGTSGSVTSVVQGNLAASP